MVTGIRLDVITDKGKCKIIMIGANGTGNYCIKDDHFNVSRISGIESKSRINPIESSKLSCHLSLSLLAGPLITRGITLITIITVI